MHVEMIFPGCHNPGISSLFVFVTKRSHSNSQNFDFVEPKKTHKNQTNATRFEEASIDRHSPACLCCLAWAQPHPIQAPCLARTFVCFRACLPCFRIQYHSVFRAARSPAARFDPIAPHCAASASSTNSATCSAVQGRSVRTTFGVCLSLVPMRVNEFRQRQATVEMI